MSANFSFLLRSVGDVQLRVTINGQQWSAQALEFTYFPHTRITNLLPTKGPINGNTRVAVHGQSFVQRQEVLELVTCRFEQYRTVYVKAMMVSANALMYVIIHASLFHTPALHAYALVITLLQMRYNS